MKMFVAIAFLFLNLPSIQAGIPIKTTEYYSPTEMLIARESWKKIEPCLIKKKIPTNLFSFFDSIAAEEEWGHMGYHGANHGFRFYQDVIKFTIQEILGIPIRDDFHFLRIPGDADLNLNSVNEFVKFWGNSQVDNRDKLRAKQLLSMNYGIYSNFETSGSCSAALFAKDRSATSIDYVKELEPFYNKLGINTKSLGDLLSIYNSFLGDKGGILLQISENSHETDPKKEAYNYADKHCYPAIRGGYRYDDNLVSAHYKTAMTVDYINKSVDISDQLRLIINNQHTLNPNSNLKIKRWDLQDSKKIRAYENAMKAAIRNLKFDSKKMVKYHDLLKKSWKQIRSR